MTERPDVEIAVLKVQITHLTQQMQTLNEFSGASSLIGKQVTLQQDASTTAQGIVTGVDTSTDTPHIIVNGQNYNLSQLLSVANPSSTP